MTSTFQAQCMLNPVFSLNKSLPRLCSITAPDLCKPSVLTFIVFEFKMSVPPTYYMEFAFVCCRKLTERYGHIFCVAP
jgi:hypothetical protein